MESDASPKHNGWDKPFIAKASALYIRTRSHVKLHTKSAVNTISSINRSLLYLSLQPHKKALTSLSDPNEI